MPVTFNEQIKVLIELQKFDSEIYDLKQELALHPAQRKSAEAEQERKKSSLKAAEEEQKTLQLKQKEKEIQLQSIEEKIKKLQSQLYQLKTNKEYSAMEMEIKGLKADQSLLEEEILRLLDTVDAAKAKVAGEKEVLAGEGQKLKKELETLSKRAAEIQARVAECEGQRKQYVPQIEPRLLSMYVRVLKSREGIALVPVRKGSCSGCNLELPPQVVNEIHMQEKLVVCESCARILYWPG